MIQKGSAAIGSQATFAGSAFLWELTFPSELFFLH